MLFRSPKHRAGRVKQWLNYMRRVYPEAAEMFAQVRTMTDSRQVDECLRQLPPLCPA